MVSVSESESSGALHFGSSEFAVDDRLACAYIHK